MTRTLTQIAPAIPGRRIEPGMIIDTQRLGRLRVLAVIEPGPDHRVTIASVD